MVSAVVEVSVPPSLPAALHRQRRQPDSSLFAARAAALHGVQIHGREASDSCVPAVEKRLLRVCLHRFNCACALVCVRLCVCEYI